jgi:hypothetical protein
MQYIVPMLANFSFGCFLSDVHPNLSLWQVVLSGAVFAVATDCVIQLLKR